MTRLLLLAAALTLGLAPMQCGSGNTDDTHYETPPEAIYDLAQHFKKAGNQAAYRETLDYLIERYPNSRFAMRAKSERESR
ncbi:MAG TPA: hypothetical protein VGP93_07755 [Polyangiaceae bacterium]|nr:hypothetical protein [Polyangiaceae bacterium]